jgi:orotidine-5'-phosphate decarboxylase
MEAASMRQLYGDDFLLVTPGIRPAGSASDDQRRIMTPVDAINSGSSYLVIGRPVTQADDPVSVLRTINSEIS